MPLALAYQSGTYTPTITNNANLDSTTAYACNYVRVGNVVTVSGLVVVDCTLASTATSLYISLPIASDLVAINDLGGAAACPAVFGLCAAIYADTAGNRAYMAFNNGGAITSQSLTFSFTYRVL